MAAHENVVDSNGAVKVTAASRNGWRLRNVIFLAGLGLGGLGLAGSAPALALSRQAPEQELAARTSFISKSVFYLPVEINERARASLREVQLYYKEGANRPWMLKEKASPKQTYFTFQAPHDGEYWFTVVTVDKMGRSTPADIRKELPSLIVVHDSQKPQVEIRPMPATEEGTAVHCLVRDANPDPTKTRFFYQTGDQMWRPLGPGPKRPDVYCIPPQAVFTGMVRVEASDLAGNKISREANLGAMAGANAPAQAPTPAGPAITPTSLSQLDENPVPPKSVQSKSQVPATFPVETVEETPDPTTTAMNPTGPDLIVPAQVAKNSAPPACSKIARTVADGPAIATGQDSGSDTVPATPRPSGPAAPAAKHLVNKNHIFLQYQIENTGASGIGKVEVWITSDQGQNWRKLSEDADRKSPVEVDLPGEGLFGVSLVVSNGRGFGGTAPNPGDAPEWWIEVDTTKPTAELMGVRPGTGADAGSVIVTWSAQDKNLAGDAIDLYCAATKEGPWQAIAKGLKNDGQYRWQVPANLGAEAFIRMIARDGAGNSTISETTQAVTLDDMSRPRGRVIGVTTNPPRSDPAN